MCVHNPHRSPLGIQSDNAAPTPPAFLETVTDDFPILYGSITSQVTGRWSETFDSVIIGFPNFTFLPNK
jgi:hypothetical protein